ncbi:hypothetical protein IAI58_19185 (plasmid) [Roseomonas marmotae]|uniref:hypothetical protein n=1 Tax=Roseomonas marmotae TaxID=2768161 RepID=UPI001AD67300|nr:hypothetical protein [Roseomonas marmotae]QTI81468.1 hypothetical protein IAI58_19185 [Roseomonas marmotae]
MNSDMVNALELVMIIVFVVARFAATVAVVWLVLKSSISPGWQVFLVALTIIFGIGVGLKYDNPNNAARAVEHHEVR